MELEKEIKEQIHKAIAANKLDQALSLMLKLKTYLKAKNQLILISSRLKELNESKNIGVVTESNYLVERNQIAKSILDLLDQLEKQPQSNQTIKKNNGIKILGFALLLIAGTTVVYFLNFQKKSELVHRVITVEESIFKTFSQDNDLRLLQQIEKILPNFIDLYSIKEGDAIEVFYDEYYKIQALKFKNEEIEQELFLYSKDSLPLYYDKNGYPADRKFLLCPVELSSNVIAEYDYNVSSGFGKRTHPVTGKVTTHLGTDYTGPINTPVYAVGDGIITVAKNSLNNGNYVKIKHDEIYETQYLHLNGFAPKLKEGANIRKGELIGYIGSTGLATGPHVCFRFWKGGRQIDPRTEDLPKGEKLTADQLGKFYHTLDSLNISFSDSNK